MAAGTDIPPTEGALDGAYKVGILDCPQIHSNGSTIEVANNSVTSSVEKSLQINGCTPSTSTSSSFDQVRERIAKDFLPLIRSGGWMDIGGRSKMEDTHVRIDDLVEHLGDLVLGGGTGSFYGVFDGHDGKNAAQFVRENLLRYILEDVSFPAAVGEAVNGVRRAFLKTENAFAQACELDNELASGTTALTVLIFGKTLLVANVGDCRAVLSKKGRAVEMSRDHKASCVVERMRIEAVGGYVEDGYLNGQLSVARALGDFHLDGLKKEIGVDGPLSAEPEMQQTEITEEDEFLIIGCDGLWDVFSSQDAVSFVRRRLQMHNDPERCSKELIVEALKRETSDNLTVVTVCFTGNPPPNLRSSISTPIRTISAEGLRNLQGLLDSI